jgi:hypothetical protein
MACVLASGSTESTPGRPRSRVASAAVMGAAKPTTAWLNRTVGAVRASAATPSTFCPVAICTTYPLVGSGATAPGTGTTLGSSIPTDTPSDAVAEESAESKPGTVTESNGKDRFDADQ